MSGKPFSTPVSFMRDNNVVLLLSSQNTNWWRNLRGGGVAVDMEIRGEYLPGTAEVMEGDSEALRSCLRKFLHAVPRDAIVYGLKLDREKNLIEDGIESKLGNIVAIKVDLH